ncbi:RmlC-like cupin domain-containing protein [Phaeosphaeria sp. MPI-PUGE-AT-0046c]|nr:RmlC-like cupin domain-containing protein [Phaeosphaeria sp. MPI-PUGE-AT-0046c]
MGSTKAAKSSVTVPTILDALTIANRVAERFPDASVGGDVSWKTLISQPGTSTDTFTVGIASCRPQGRGEGGVGLKMHRHTHAEVYYVVAGRGVVTVEGEEYEVQEGGVVFIPGDAEHGMRCVGSEEVKWLYIFAADGFEKVEYRFGGSNLAETGVKAKL